MLVAARAATMAAGNSLALSLVIRRDDCARSTAAFIVVVIYAGIFLVRTAALVTIVAVAFNAPAVLILGCSYAGATPSSANAGCTVVVVSLTSLLPGCPVVGTVMSLSVGFDLIVVVVVVVPISINSSVICVKLVSCAANFRSIRRLEFCVAMANTMRPLAAAMTTATTTKSVMQRHFILTVTIEERAELNGLVNDAGERVVSRIECFVY